MPLGRAKSSIGQLLAQRGVSRYNLECVLNAPPSWSGFGKNRGSRRFLGRTLSPGSEAIRSKTVDSGISEPMANVTTEQNPDFVLAHLSGELTASVAEDVRDDLQGLAAERGTKLAIDLSELNMIDSSGLSILMSIVTRARLAEGRVILVSPTAFVTSVFEVTRLVDWFEIAESLDDARRRFSDT